MTEMDEAFWDGRYAEQERLFSGNANGVLVAEAGDLTPGRALDLGAGEGADAIWLAVRGWHVTAMEISGVAVSRAEKAATEAGVKVDWRHADLLTTAPEPGAYDLVSAQYLPIPHEPDHPTVRAMLAAVAPGGTLLFVHHAPPDDPGDWTGPDISEFYSPHEIATMLDESWTIESDETRPRVAPAPPGSHHTHDTILRAHRA